VSETGLVYTFTTPKLQPLVTKAEGKNLIQVRLDNAPTHLALSASANNSSQACLNAPEPAPGNENGVDDVNTVESPEEPPAHLPPQSGRTSMPANHMPGNYMPSVGMDAQSAQALAYTNYVNQQQGARYLSQQGLPQHASHQS
jgi:pheromone receptor transcription factor